MGNNHEHPKETIKAHVAQASYTQSLLLPRLRQGVLEAIDQSRSMSQLLLGEGTHDDWEGRAVMEAQLLTLKQIAAHLNVSQHTIYYWVERHEIPVIRLGRLLRFRLDEVLKYFEQKTTDHRESCTGSPDSATPPLRSLKSRNGRLASGKR